MVVHAETQLCAKTSEENSPMKEGLSSIVANRIYGATASYYLNKCINLIELFDTTYLKTMTNKVCSVVLNKHPLSLASILGQHRLGIADK